MTVSMGKATFDQVTLISNPGVGGEVMKVLLQQFDTSSIEAAYAMAPKFNYYDDNLNSKIS